MGDPKSCENGITPASTYRYRHKRRVRRIGTRAEPRWHVDRHKLAESMGMVREAHNDCNPSSAPARPVQRTEIIAGLAVAGAVATGDGGRLLTLHQGVFRRTCFAAQSALCVMQQ